ncbi:MAG TPA: gamma carbonic anhydrase family protein [Ignavibacteria bacterium]|nr:gamma carbonic anhydrase family protein [Ignavibacteria bacterium]
MIYSYKGITPLIKETVYICDGVHIVGDVEIDDDSSVWFNSVIRGDVNFVRIGKRTNVQDNSTLHVFHDYYPLIIGDDVTIGHNAVVHGCKLKNNILIGMNATLLDDCEISSNVIIAAGTLVKEKFKVPEGVLVAGVPGKIIRDLKPEEIDGVAQSAQNYVNYVKTYRTEVKLIK